MKKPKKDRGTVFDAIRNALKSVSDVVGRWAYVNRAEIRHKARARWWHEKRLAAYRIAKETSEKFYNCRLLVKGNPFLGIEGTHHYVARISRKQATRRMRQLNGPLMLASGE